MRNLPDKISLIIPFYNEGDNIDELFKRLLAITPKIECEWEVLCVVDGGSDNTLEKLVSMHSLHPFIKIISLSRNFGKEQALSAGIDHADADIYIPLDSDLQDPPELIIDMLKKWQEGYDVVLATRNKNINSSRNFVTNAFYYLINNISNTDIPIHTGDFRLLDKKVIAVIRQMHEKTRFMKGIMSWAGYKTTQIYFDREQRYSGNSKWNCSGLFKLAMDSMFSFSYFPIKVIGVAGCAISTFGLTGLIFIESQNLFIASAIMLACGTNLIAIWLIGQYIARINEEVRNRPLYVIGEKIGF